MFCLCVGQRSLVVKGTGPFYHRINEPEGPYDSLQVYIIIR